MKSRHSTFLERAQELKIEFGQISPMLLQRKLKITSDKANQIIEEMKLLEDDLD